MFDSTVAHAKLSTSPLLCSDFNSAIYRSFWEDARTHGFHSGWAQSRRDAHGTIGLLILARSDENITFREPGKISVQITWLAQTAHEGILPWLAGKYKQETVTSLIAREIEVPRWSVDGRTTEDVSRIMSISYRTVNFYISNALKNSMRLTKLVKPSRQLCSAFYKESSIRKNMLVAVSSYRYYPYLFVVFLDKLSRFLLMIKSCFQFSANRIRQSLPVSSVAHHG